MLRNSALVLIIALLGLGSPSALHADTPNLPQGFTREVVVQGLTQPTSFAFAGDKLFVAQRNGEVRVILPGGMIRNQPYLTVGVSLEGERGLGGIAIHPKYPTQPYVYIYYTTGPGAVKYSGIPQNRLSRFRTVNGVGTREEILLDHIPSSSQGVHNGGDLHFGFDGKLYVSVGDGGVEANAQRLKSLSGKILRLNPDGSIPPDNPFAGQIKPRPEIFAFGFRNPWRMALRPSTRSYFAGDVGSATWEELDRIKPGRNYGWPHFEGPCLQGILCKPSKTDFQGTIPPVFYYPHQNPPDAYNAVIAGAFADHSNYPPPYRGGLFMADLVGWVRVLTFDSHDKLTGDLSFDMVDSPVDFQRGPDGSIYVVSFWSGIIYRYVYAPPVEAARRPTSGNGTGQ